MSHHNICHIVLRNNALPVIGSGIILIRNNSTPTKYLWHHILLTVSPRINVHALISENRMFQGCFKVVLCSNISACTCFRKLSVPLNRNFVAKSDTLNDKKKLVY